MPVALRLFNPEAPPRVKRRRKLPDFLRDTEIDALLNAAYRHWQDTPDRCPKWKQARYRDWVLIQVGLFTGLRVSELSKQRIEDISLADSAIIVRRGKGDADGSVPIAARLKQPLADWIGKRTEGFLFPDPRGSRLHIRHILHRVHTLAKLAGIKRKVCVHLLRHTFATQCWKRCKDILKVQPLMRHVDVRTTMIYCHVLPLDLQHVVDML